MNSNDYDPPNAARWPRLLCIDDDPQICEAIGLRLREYEVDVICGYHGTHGFWLAATERPDLIITDMRLPQGEGDYVVECMRNNSDTRGIPIIVMTGQRGPEIVERIRRLDVQAFFTKPVSFEQLLAVIRQHIPLRPRAAEPETVGE